MNNEVQELMASAGRAEREWQRAKQVELVARAAFDDAMDAVTEALYGAIDDLADKLKAPA